MWKTTAQTALIALSLVTFGTGCDLADFINNIGGGGVVIQPEPLPVPVPTPGPDDCDAQLDQCLNDIWGGGQDDGMTVGTDYWDPTTGPAEEACFDAYAVCLDLTLPPPPPTCETELDDCLAGLYDVDITLPANRAPADLPYWDPAEQACYDAYDDCTGVQPPPPPIDDCELELDQCLQDIWMDPTITTFPTDVEEQACFDQYAVCLDDTYPPPPPVDACDQLFTDCLDNGVSYGLCEAVLDECVLNQQPCPDHHHEPGYPGHDDDTDPVDALPMP